MKKIYKFEPWFFMFFAVFHLHRIWGLVDRNSYAEFWINVMVSKGLFYLVLMGILSVLCALGWIYSYGRCSVGIGRFITVKGEWK